MSETKAFNLAVIGATGLVGEELLRVLDERSFPVASLRLFASGGSEEKFLEYGGDEIPVEVLTADGVAGYDIVFFCAGDAVSRDFLPQVKKSGALCIDMSGAFSGAGTIFVPEVNDDALEAAYQDGLVVSPAPLSTALALVLAPLTALGAIRRTVVSSYEAVSSVGRKGVDVLRDEIADLLNGRSAEGDGPFPQQVAFSAVPQVGSWGIGGSTVYEERIVDEVSALLGGRIALHLTAVQIPAFFGHGAALSVEFDRGVDLQKVRELLAGASGIAMADESLVPCYPVPVDAAGQDDVLVGRLRQQSGESTVITCWLVIDNLRKGAATNAVQIAELLAGRYLL